MIPLLVRAKILQTEQLAEDVFRLTALAPDIANLAKPGQFVMVKTTGTHDPLLRRPFSIHQATSGGWVQILFKALGKGTRSLAAMQAGGTLDMIGPLGKGFFTMAKNTCIIGGGMGIAPMLFLTGKLLQQEKLPNIRLLLGARNKNELYIANEFTEMGITPHIATDDGSEGHHGLVTDLLEETLAEKTAWAVYACGPHPMLKAVAGICKKRGRPCQVSLETMMACGLAACLGCTVTSSNQEQPYLHVCKDGPVFEAGDIQWT